MPNNKGSITMYLLKKNSNLNISYVNSGIPVIPNSFAQSATIESYRSQPDLCNCICLISRDRPVADFNL